MGVEERTLELDGQPVHLLLAPDRGATRVIYLHGMPTGAADWMALLGLTGGLAPDLPGFGRSGKGGHLDLSPAGYAGFLDRFLELTATEAPVDLVAHGFGAAVALLWTARAPQRARQLVLVDPVVPLSGQRPPRPARVLARRGVGELALGMTTRRLLARTLRGASTSPDRAWPARRIDELWRDFDPGTQRALVRAHRRAAAAPLTAEALGGVSAPVLILRGEADPWSTPAAVTALAAALPDARTETIVGAGHWPWLDRPETAGWIAERLVPR